MFRYISFSQISWRVYPQAFATKQGEDEDADRGKKWFVPVRIMCYGRGKSSAMESGG